MGPRGLLPAQGDLPLEEEEVLIKERRKSLEEPSAKTPANQPEGGVLGLSGAVEAERRSAGAGVCWDWHTGDECEGRFP